MRTVMALALLLVTLAEAVPTDTLRIDLTWEAPESCPESDDIERDVRRILGDARVPPNLEPIAARVSLVPSDDGSFELVMRTKTTNLERERSLRVEGCAEARDLVAFLLAMLVDPNARPPAPSSSAAEPSPPEPEPAPETVAPRVSDAPRKSSPPASAARRVRFSASASGGAELGVLPEASFGGELRAGLAWPAWSVAARAAAWQAQRAESDSVIGAGGDFRLIEAGILACARWSNAADVASELCAGPALLEMRGRGFGVANPDRASAAWFAVSAEAAGLMELSESLAVRASLAALVPLSRPTFAIRDVGSIHRPSAVAGRALLGVEVRF